MSLRCTALYRTALQSTTNIRDESGRALHAQPRSHRTDCAGYPGLRWLPQGLEKFYLRRFRKSAVLGADDGHAARHEHFNEAEADADFTLGALNPAKPYAPNNLNPKP